LIYGGGYEYIGLMHMRILKRPLVVERERINFY